MLMVSKSLAISTLIIVSSNEENVIAYSIVGILAIIGCMFIRVGGKENLTKEGKKTSTKSKKQAAMSLIREDKLVGERSFNKEQEETSDDIDQSMDTEKIKIKDKHNLSSISVAEEDVVEVINRFELKHKKNHRE